MYKDKVKMQDEILNLAENKYGQFRYAGMWGAAFALLTENQLKQIIETMEKN
jgi:hypothetical protein